MPSKGIAKAEQMQSKGQAKAKLCFAWFCLSILGTNKSLWPLKGYFKENISRGLGLKRVLVFQSCLILFSTPKSRFHKRARKTAFVR